MRLVPRDLSIERKLPLLVGALLLVVVLVLSGAAYREVRRAAWLIASERLARATRELADVFQRSATQRITETRTLASDSSIRALLGSSAPTPALRGRALAALRRVARETAANVAVELRDSSGRLLLRSGDSTLTPAAEPGPLPADSAVVGPLRALRDTVLGYDVRARVPPGDGPGRGEGRVIQIRRMNLSAQAQQTLRALTGGDVTLLFGNAAGDPWTDFARLIPAPAPGAEGRAGRGPTEYRRGEAKLGAAALVRGTPWMCIAELPRRQVLSPAQVFLVRISAIAAVIVALGGLAAWWLSHRITTPLRRLTAGVEGIAAGALSQRVPSGSQDELGRLASAFNVMAEHVEAARRELEARVQQRTAELESFSYSISHDLRAPLRAIDGFSRMLIEDHGGELSAEGRRLLEVIRSNTQRMGQLIDDLLTFSRLGRREPVVSRVDMTALAEGVAAELRRAEHDRAVELVIAPLAPARADAALLRQVWANLISNALKFTRQRTDARLEIGSRADGRETVYYVRDNGAGFDMRYADKLFGVFQRLHRLEEFEGTGVGLAIVQRVVQRHGGRVWAEGRVDEGATFYFTLPTGEERTA